MSSAVNALTGRARRVSCALLASLGLAAVLSAGTTAAAHGTDRMSALPQPAARITAVKKIDARTEDLTVSSPAMNRSIPVRVILPKSWATKKNSTFPVLYMLHGGDDDYTSWTRETDIEALAENSDVLIVMPDGGRAGYYSDWHLGAPRWETFHTSELVRLMEKQYRASSSRAVVGLSMGGLGALNYTARHRGMFRYVAAMSSYVDLNDPAVRLVLALGSQRDGTDINQVWGDPNKNAEIWQAHNPSAMPKAFRGTTVHISCGYGYPGPLDQGHALDVILVGALAEAVLPDSVKRFAGSLRSAGVRTTTHIYGPGTHSWPYWQRELHEIWPTVMTSLR
ncbi:alpha/beta hydrolase family protein [Streptomyces sp. NPDC002688]|uniref:alpha/beta hydrolase n=1 Tax=Streptomyces sp. NPDC002688 TaxID=3154423 RepID=UPI00332FFFE9